MRKTLVATTFLASFASVAHAQSVQTGSIGGMSYYLLPASGGCSASTPCSVVTYLGYQSESSGATEQDLTNYFGGAFVQANPHTMVVAPVENGPQDATTNWGGYDSATTPEQAQMVAVVQGVEQQMGNSVNPADSVVTGGSLGGTGTQAALIAYGPKGTVQPGVFSAGLSFDASDWAAAGNSTQIAALCGVPLTAVHGTADTNQNISFDQNLASAVDGNPACGNSMTLTPVQGHGHGTWSDPSVGYGAGTGSGTPLGWLTSQLTAGAGSVGPTTAQVATATPSGGATQVTTSPATTTPVAASTGPQTAPSIESATIKPGGGSITDAQGHVWTITASGSILEDGQYTPGGGGTSALTILNGVVYGQDDGHDGNIVNSGGWFTLSSNDQSWQVSGAAAAAPTPSKSTPAAPQVTQTLPPVVDQCSTAVPNYAASDGGFGTIDGQFYSPNGQPWIAQGVNVPDFDMATAESSLLSLLPNTNFIRLNIYSYADPSTYQSFINWASSHGVVVEIDDHTSFPSNAFSGSQLAAETQFFSSMASAYKTNPYVWFETQNEPQGGDITDEQVAVYNAVRNAGNNNPVGLQLYGGGDPGFLSTMNVSAYSSMTNTFLAPHFYDWLAGYSSDPATVWAALQTETGQARTITSADGKMPIIIDEYGDSTDGTSIDGGGSATVAAVNQSGYGSAAWSFMNPGGGSADQLTNDGQSLTAMGQQIAGYMTGTSAGCAQSPVPTVTSDTAPPLAPGSTTETAPALAPASTVQTAPPLAANSLTIDRVAALAATGQ